VGEPLRGRVGQHLPAGHQHHRLPARFHPGLRQQPAAVVAVCVVELVPDSVAAQQIA
jgi:hypothetical protein